MISPKLLLLSLFASPCLLAQQQTITEQFTLPFTADSGTLPVPASGPQSVAQPLTFIFPPNFPVDTQACLAALAQGAGVCRAEDVPVPVTVTYYPQTPSVSPGQSAHLSGQVILAGALAQSGSKNGRFEYNKTITCLPSGSCSTGDGTNPIMQYFRFPVPVNVATFALSASLSQRGAPTQRLDFGTAHLSGLLTVSVQSHAPTVTLLDPVTPDPSLSLLAGSAVTADKSKLAQGGSLVRGIAADGTAEMVIRIAAASLGEHFTISQNGGDGFLGAIGSTPASQGDLLVTADYTSPVDGKPYAFALYKAPASFVRSRSSGDTDLTSRQVSLTVTLEGSTSSTLVPIRIWRPPVVLIHGIWSSPSAWKDFTPLVSVASDGTQAFDSRFDGYLVDYHDNASDSISSIVNMDNGALSQLTDDIKSFKAKHQAAAVQADVVAHSMGGLVTRDMALSPSFLLQTYGKGMLHKLITIGTPHSGTPIAGRLLNSSLFCRAALLLAGHAVAGAVTDLQPNSALINSLSSLGVPLQAHALAGDASTAQEVASEVALDGVGFFVSSELHTNVCFGILPLGGYQQLYGGDSDLLVPLASQTYGFDNRSRDMYPETEHTIIPVLFPLGPDELNRDSTFSLGFLTSPGTSIIPDRVIDLLNDPFAQQDFTTITP